MMSKDLKLVMGVDEVGRGPLAGPVTVGVFIAPSLRAPQLLKILGGKIKDSKKLLPKRRYTIYRILKTLKKERKVDFHITHISNRVIDKRGITEAIRRGIKIVIKKSEIKRNNLGKLKIVLDGLLKAPKEFKNQRTIIKGDEKNIFIAIASIVAKVRRDRLMKSLHRKYPKYKLDVHRGYGTAMHRKLIKKYGLSRIHRKSFCNKIF